MWRCGAAGSPQTPPTETCCQKQTNQEKSASTAGAAAPPLLCVVSCVRHSCLSPAAGCCAGGPPPPAAGHTPHSQQRARLGLRRRPEGPTTAWLRGRHASRHHNEEFLSFLCFISTCCRSPLEHCCRVSPSAPNVRVPFPSHSLRPHEQFLRQLLDFRCRLAARQELVEQVQLPDRALLSAILARLIHPTNQGGNLLHDLVRLGRELVLRGVGGARGAAVNSLSASTYLIYLHLWKCQQACSHPVSSVRSVEHIVALHARHVVR